MTHGYSTWFTPGFITATQRYRPTECTLSNLSSQLRMHLRAARILVQRDGISYWCPKHGEEVALDEDFAAELQEKIVQRWGRAGVRDIEELHRNEVLNLRKAVDNAVLVKLRQLELEIRSTTTTTGDECLEGTSGR